MTIIEHAEKYLGQINQGWKDNDSGEGLQIVSFVEPQVGMADLRVQPSYPAPVELPQLASSLK